MTIPQSKPSKITDEQLDSIEAYLRANATAEPVTTSELVTECVPELADSHDTNPTVRTAVQYLLHSGRLAVDGSGQGYRVPTSEADREDAIESLREHIGKLNARVQSLKEAPLADAGETVEPEQPCEKCGGGIDGDPYLWYSVELCYECYERKPPSESAFREWVESGVEA